jgi:hypothetical protein
MVSNDILLAMLLMIKRGTVKSIAAEDRLLVVLKQIEHSGYLSAESDAQLTEASGLNIPFLIEHKYNLSRQRFKEWLDKKVIDLPMIIGAIRHYHYDYE